MFAKIRYMLEFRQKENERQQKLREIRLADLSIQEDFFDSYSRCLPEPDPEKVARGINFWDKVKHIFG